MALTDSCDLFGSIHEDGVNLVARHVMQQRPSLFNYGTSQVAANRKLWCEQVKVAPDVVNFSDPVMTVVPPLPIGNTGYGVNYCLQLTKAEIDFHGGNIIALPAELNPPLPPQHFSARARVCGGIGCPPDEVVDRLPPPRPTSKKDQDRPQKPLTPLPFRRLECFCLEVFVVGHVEVDGDELVPRLDGLEIVDITPDGLREQPRVLPRVADQARDRSSAPGRDSGARVRDSRPGDGHAHADADLRSGSKQPGDRGRPAEGLRGRGGGPMSHLTVAASEDAFRDLFAVLRDNFTFASSDSASFGPFSASYAVALHLEDGSVDLRADNTVRCRASSTSSRDTLGVGVGSTSTRSASAAGASSRRRSGVPSGFPKSASSAATRTSGSRSTWRDLTSELSSPRAP